MRAIRLLFPIEDGTNRDEDLRVRTRKRIHAIRCCIAYAIMHTRIDCRRYRRRIFPSGLLRERDKTCFLSPAARREISPADLSSPAICAARCSPSFFEKEINVRFHNGTACWPASDATIKSARRARLYHRAFVKHYALINGKI